jgi:hypothetical protein
MDKFREIYLLMIPGTDSWTQVAFLGQRLAGVGFSINGKGYYSTGIGDNGDLQKDIWEFVPQ